MNATPMPPLEVRIEQIRAEIDAVIDAKTMAVARQSPGVPLGVIRNLLTARAGATKADFTAPSGAVFAGKADTTVTFSEPGEYVLRVVGNDWSGEGGGGFQCCWTNAQIKVTVK